MLVRDVLLVFVEHSDIFMWVVCAVVMAAAGFMLWWQRREQTRLQKELDILESMNRQNVEIDMVLKTMKVATWKIDVPSRMVTFDSDYRTYSDYLSARELPMADFAKRIAPEDRDWIHQNMLALMEGRSEEYTVRYRVCPLGHDRYVWEESFCMVTEHNEAGEPLTIVGISMSIDDQKRVEQELIEARNKAEESDRLKSAFLANISHEIRTPLNAIVGFSDILPMVENKEEHAHLISLIQENNQKLLRMIEDIVNISKLESGSQAPNMEHFDLNMLLREKSDMYRLKNQNPDVEILADLQGGPMMIYSDRERVAEILEQYMLNAVKFTETGSITLGYDQMPGNHVRIWVRDTGKGIPADQQDNIFEHFVKLDEFVPGTGLGLPICRSTAQSINAWVGVDSQEGIGSTFWVEIINNA